MRHNGYNDVQAGTKGGDFKYQGQERNEDLGLNWDSFKWRNYDYAIGRFMSIDPLAEKYTYNSTYAFSDNKLGMGIELEGLEVFPTDLAVWFSIKASEMQAKFKGSAKKVIEANTNTIEKAVQRADPNFDPERARIERIAQTAEGLNDMAEVVGDVGHLTLDVIGTAEPTGLVDGVHSLWYAAEGDYLNAGLTAAGMLPYIGDSFKAGKYLKYGDEVADLVKATGKLDGAPKEIITVLKEGTLENGIKVANDAIGGLGDDAVEKLGKFGSQNNVRVGSQSANGKKGWRIDYDSKKGGHINWWNGNEKGAIPINAGQNQIDQIIKNGTF